MQERSRMDGRIHVAVVAATVGCFTTLLLLLIWRLCHHKKEQENFVEPNSLTRMENLLQSGIVRLPHHHQPSINHQFDHHMSKNNKGNFYVFHGGGVTGKKKQHLFNWVDNPHLAADAVENGWSQFAFNGYKSYMLSPSKRSTLLGVCAAAGDYGRESSEPEITWEVCQGSSEFMQKIRLNPNNSSMSVVSVIRTGLPLPGPSLGNHAFPQEAYFEVTIFYSQQVGGDHELVWKKREGEKTKLLNIIQDTSIANKKGKLDNVEEMKLDLKEGGSGKSGSVLLSLGLTAGGAPLRVPGSYPGSIGFNSNGSVFLDGMKLLSESEKAEWVGTDKVIGCGFDPRQKKVFFTLDSELVHAFHCQSEEFGSPLCPTIAANIDIVVLVNFGQSAFKYAPANAQRTPNPCFISPLVNSPAATIGYEDSKELFSMGRIDSSQWHNQSTTPKGNHNNLDFDEESEADLFEITIDGSGKSPHRVS